MIDEALQDLQSNIDKAHEALRRELTKLRAGRAHPSLLDSIKVDFYGSLTPIPRMANVSVPEARSLLVKPWDKSQVKAVERAIMESDLGLNPQTEGEVIRVPLPPLTEERRRDLVKIAKKNGEDAKIAIRKARQETKEFLSSLENEGAESADDVERAQKKMEEIVRKAQSEVDEIVARKEKDISEV